MSKKNIVDFVPKYSVTGDLHKVSEKDIKELNIYVSALENLFRLEKGRNIEMPEVGLLDTLMRIPYSDKLNIPSIMSSVEGQISSVFSRPVMVDYEEDEKDPETYNLIFRFDNLPPVKFDIESRGSRARIINPRIIS